LQNVSIRIEQIDLGLIVKTERTLKITSAGIVGIEISELYLAKVLCFEPMNHGRHEAAGFR
jgi:hypothetical protein